MLLFTSSPLVARKRKIIKTLWDTKPGVRLSVTVCPPGWLICVVADIFDYAIVFHHQNWWRRVSAHFLIHPTSHKLFQSPVVKEVRRLLRLYMEARREPQNLHFQHFFFLGLRTTQVSKFWEVGTHAGTFVEESDQLFCLQYCIDQ